jgi:hypothetical protein
MNKVCFSTIPDFAAVSSLWCDGRQESERCVVVNIIRRCASYKVVGWSSLILGSFWARISTTNKVLQMEKAHVRGVFHAGLGSASRAQEHSIGPVQHGQTGARVLLLAQRKEGDGQDACY